MTAVRQQAITWTNVDPDDLWSHMASVGHNELKCPCMTLAPSLWDCWDCNAVVSAVLPSARPPNSPSQLAPGQQQPQITSHPHDPVAMAGVIIKCQPSIYIPGEWGSILKLSFSQQPLHYFQNGVMETNGNMIIKDGVEQMCIRARARHVENGVLDTYGTHCKHNY